MSDIPICKLLDAWVIVKAKLDQVAAEELDLRLAIRGVAAPLNPPEDGTKKYRLGVYEVALIGRMNYKCTDIAGYVAAGGPIKHAMDATGFKSLKKADPVHYQKLARYVEKTPGTPGMTVKLAKDED